MSTRTAGAIIRPSDGFRWQPKGILTPGASAVKARRAAQGCGSNNQPSSYFSCPALLEAKIMELERAHSHRSDDKLLL